MKNQNIDNMKDEDFSKLMSAMKTYNVTVPEQEEIDNTIEILRQYVPKHREDRSILNGRTAEIIYNAVNEIKFMSKYFWIVSFILFLTGFYIVQENIDINFWYKPYIMIVLMAPVPFLLGIIEIYRGRDEGVLEIELSCKISEREVMLSRLLVVGIYNVILNTVLSAVLSSFNTGINIFRAAFLWITPFTIVCGIALILSSRIRGGYAATVLVSSWMIFVISVLSQKHVIEKLLTINLWAYVFLSAAGIIFTGYQIKQALIGCINLSGGKDIIESKN